jgi:hypothetical protein
MLLPLTLVCSMLMQEQSIVVKFSESKSHIIIAIKTSEPINPGIQGKFGVQFRRGENFVVYNDRSLRNGRVRQLEFNTPKQLEMIKVVFFIPGENGYKPFGLGFRRNFVQTPKPNQPPDAGKLNFVLGTDGDGDGFPTATLLEDSRNWDLFLDSNDFYPQINPLAGFAYEPLNVNGELISDLNGDGETELEFSDDLGVYDPLNTKTGSRVGWLVRVPRAYEFGERVMFINGDFVLASVIRGAR